MNRGRARVVGARRRVDPNVKRTVNALKSALHGHANRLMRADPPPFTKAPYQSITVSQKIAGVPSAYNFTTKDISVYLLTQLGIPSASIVALSTLVTFKLRRVDVYTSAIGSSTEAPKVQLTAKSLIPTTNPSTTETVYPTLKRLEDTGNLSENAVVSYSWPTHMADTPLDDNADFEVCLVEPNLANSTTVRFHIQWSFGGIP